jgi:hypothetical protein
MRSIGGFIRMNQKEDIMETGFGCTILLVAIVFSTVFDGMVLVKMWEWFIVPTFNAPMLSLPVAIGVGLIVAFLTVHSMQETEKDFVERALSTLMWVVAKPLIYLFIGWIVTLFM